MRWLWPRIPARTETVTELGFDIGEGRRTLAKMEVDDWRTASPKIKGEQAVVLSAGTLDKPRWTWRGRPAAKQSRGRGGCMNELERQLTAALKTLSARSETERRRQSEQAEALHEQVEALLRQVERQTEENDTLRRRIERLDEQVTRLTGYYGTSAAVRPRGRGW